MKDASSIPPQGVKRSARRALITPLFDVSVIVCTHNPRTDYLSRTLEALREQSVSKERWELIVVDNASGSPVAPRWDLSWHRHGRHVTEPKLGLSSARQKGINSSSGRLLIFVDDDNVLEANYLKEALRIEADFQFLGVWGSGSIVPEFEVEPAIHARPLIPWLAIRESAKPVWGNSISLSDGTPVGAGLCVRRNIGQDYVEFCKSSTIEISGRKGRSLGGHEDFEICYLACNCGLGMGIFPELKILHLIAKERIRDEYLLRLVSNLTISQHMLDYKWKGTIPRSPFTASGLAIMAKAMFTRRGFDRRIYFAELWALIVARRMLRRRTTLGSKRPELQTDSVGFVAADEQGRAVNAPGLAGTDGNSLR